MQKRDIYNITLKGGREKPKKTTHSARRAHIENSGKRSVPHIFQIPQKCAKERQRNYNDGLKKPYNIRSLDLISMFASWHKTSVNSLGGFCGNRENEYANGAGMCRKFHGRINITSLPLHGFLPLCPNGSFFVCLIDAEFERSEGYYDNFNFLIKLLGAFSHWSFFPYIF